MTTHECKDCGHIPKYCMCDFEPKSASDSELVEFFHNAICGVEVSDFIEADSTDQPSDALFATLKSGLVRGPIEGEMWECAAQRFTVYDSVRVGDRVIANFVEPSDAEAFVTEHNASIQRVADLGEPRDENGPRSQ